MFAFADNEKFECRDDYNDDNVRECEKRNSHSKLCFDLLIIIQVSELSIEKK